MRFFTREWHSGEMPDSEADAVGPAYRAHVQSVLHELPPDVRDLATKLNLHDARIARVTLDADQREVQLELRCGDQQRGYEDVTLAYQDAALSAASLRALREVTEGGAELLYDEVDVVGKRRFSHQVLFWPYREVGLTFSAVTIARAPGAVRDLEARAKWVEI